MKIVGNRTMATLAVVVLVEALKGFGVVDAAHADQAKEFLLYIAGLFFASKVQAMVESSGDPR